MGAEEDFFPLKGSNDAIFFYSGESFFGDAKISVKKKGWNLLHVNWLQTLQPSWGAIWDTWMGRIEGCKPVTMSQPRNSGNRITHDASDGNGIFTYIYQLICMANVGKYSIHLDCLGKKAMNFRLKKGLSHLPCRLTGKYFGIASRPTNIGQVDGQWWCFFHYFKEKSWLVEDG